MTPGLAAQTERIDLEFDDNRLVPLLFGEHDRHLVRLETQLGVAAASRGNRLSLRGSPEALAQARQALDALWQSLKRGQAVGPGEVDAAIRMAGMPSIRQEAGGAPVIHTRRRSISARTPNQARYLKLIERHDLVFALGPAGTGKTYLAVAEAVQMLLANRVERLILSRPAIEAGERLGFLPGDLREKIDPYLRPIYDALYDMLPTEQVARRLEQGQIEVAPLAFMRGRTLANAFVILDEAQNTTPVQMKMALTRLGENSRMVVTGDLSQVDLPQGVPSGLGEALAILEGVEGVAVIRFESQDVVRHPLVARIVAAYERRARSARAPAAEEAR